MVASEVDIADVMPKTNRPKELLKRVRTLMKKERWQDAIKFVKENASVVENHSELLWNCGWCYFKLERMNEAQKYLTRAIRVSPKSYRCKFGLGVVYLEKKQYKKAELLLSEALEIKDNYITRISLALAYQAQGKLEEAETIHVNGIKLKPKESQRYEAYADFLSDIGREAEAGKMTRKATELERIN